MRLGIDIRTLMDGRYSGVPQYSFNLIKELVRINQEKETPYNLKFFYNSGRDVSEKLPEFLFAGGEVRRTRFPNKIFNYGMQKFLGRPKIDKLLGVDVFLMPHFNFTELSPGCKKILTVHDLSFLRDPRFFSLRKNVWHKLLNAKRIIREADHIITVSKNTKQDIIDICNKKSDRITVAYSGVDQEFRPLDKDSGLDNIKEKYKLPPNFILYLGTLEPRKNVEGIIRAFDIYARKYRQSDLQLVIAGMKGWKSGPILDAWKKSQNKQRIKFLGYVPNQDKVYLYNLASIFIFPSFYEGFGLPPLEAMACQTPVITSFSSSLPEVVGDSALLVDPYNIGDIFEAIKQIIEDDKLRENLAKKGLERSKRFRWQNVAQKYLQIINGIK